MIPVVVLQFNMVCKKYLSQYNNSCGGVAV